ncbi:patatin family phospholipase [Trypanosoma grayi]|uniref:patatin family phospholipase n=1 Tax=Trypanosoma grayi TaxID=71804 RepID=UPI0004F49992|nr:patatin family phospholipase [Trypanosoma grayi]KEG08768.1 patatin family phospholipase [Trypanosoma grayi]
MQSALKKKAKAATTYSEWVAIARQLDDLEGFQSWRLEEEPRYMNSEGLVGHIQLLIDAKKKGDTETLLSVLSTGLHRSAYGILNPNLYVYRSGTKAVIETYNSLLVYLIRSLARDTSVTAYTRYATLLELSRVCSNTALVFNGGMVLGPFHVGVAKALWKANLLPRIFYGGRTGSVVAALLCCKKDLSEVFEVDNLNYPAFSGKDVGALQRRSVRFWMEGHLMDIAVLAQFIKDNVGDLTFLEAYNLTGRVLNIEFTPDTDDANCTAAPPVRLLNYLTAPNVLVYSAAAASFASSPLFFGRYPLMAKDLAGRIVRYDPPVMGAVGRRADGKIDGLKRLRELFHIKCFIVSECSATRLPFLRLSGRTSLLARLGHAISEEWWRFVSFIISFTPLKKYIWVLFSNDDSDADDVIKLFPASSWTDIAGVFNLPTMRQIHECVLRGERQVWPSLKRIQEHVAPELALNDALSELSRADPKISWENDNPYSW